MASTRLLAAVSAACATVLYAAGAGAQIRIGQTVGVTGAVAATVKESMTGAQLYLNYVNAHGGVGGEKVELITLDDGFEVEKAQANARQLIEERGVVALFMSRGTPHTEAINAVLEQHKVALVGPSTGAMVLHQPVKRYIYNVRATYQREAERAMAHLLTLGTQRIAIVHVDDSFGADGRDGAQAGLRAGGISPVAVLKFDRSKPDFAPLVPVLQTAQPQATLFVGSGTAVVEGVRSFKRAGIGGQYLTLSNNASAGFVKLLGDAGPGVVVSQVMPATQGVGLVKEATQLARAQGLDEISPAMLEGFASAKVLVEALRKAGSKPTRSSVHNALETLGRVDMGGLALDYSSNDHTGLDYADLSIVTASGKFRR